MKSKKIIVIIIVMLIISVSTTTSFGAINNTFKISSELDDLAFACNNELEKLDSIEKIEETEIYKSFKEIAGDNAIIQTCGPALVESIGTGHHFIRLFDLFRIEADIPIIFPLKPIVRIWTVFNNYFNDDNASTKITTLKDNKTFYINGSHRLFAPLIWYKYFMRVGMITSPINLILGILGLENLQIKTPLKDKYQGVYPWPYSESLGTLTLIISLLLAWYTFKFIYPIRGLYIPLTTFGYVPFLIWTEP
jgi:hypothetical protein